MITITSCLAAGFAAGICNALPGDFHPPPPPPLPAWATQQVIYHLAGIVAGETVPDCEICDRWIACTIRRDIEGGQPPWTLHPGRWHGYKIPTPTHLAAVEAALSEQGCLSVPTCSHLGNLNDYRYWSAGIAQDVPSHVIGNRYGAIVCVPPPSPATPSPAPNTASTARPRPHQSPSPAPARPSRSGPADE